MFDPEKHVRQAVRQLMRKSGFTMTAILTLAIGIGATVTIFSIFYAVLLRPLPYPEADRLVNIVPLSINPATSSVITNEASYPNFRDWRDESKTFESLASYHTNSIVLNAEGSRAARNIFVGVVSAGFFHLLGIRPALGRSFERKEENAGSRVVVLSDSLWKAAFQSSPAILGKQIRLSDELYTVIGVLPENASFPFVSNVQLDLWTTPAMDAIGENPSTEQRGWTQIETIARLRRGVSKARANAEMNAIASRLAVRYPESNATETAVQINPALENMVGDIRPALRILLTAVCALLLIACANVAGLLLARGAARQQELAVRAALGASRGEIALQLLTESIVLSLFGGGAGVLLAVVSLKGLLPLIPKNLPRLDDISINTPVLLFAVGISMLTGIIFGLLPAMRLSKLNPALALRDNARVATAGRSQYRMHSALVVTETALGLVLLVGAGLLVRSFLHMLSADPGFNPKHMLYFRVGTTEKSYPEEKRVAFYSELISHLQALPGAQSATAAFPLPFSGGNMGIDFKIEGRPFAAGHELSARTSLVYPGYFQAMQIAVHDGRVFTAQDNVATAPAVAVVNQAFVRKYFPGESALGKRIETGFDNDAQRKLLHWREIVGVVEDVKRTSITEDAHPEYYVPYAQAPVAAPFMALRVSGDPTAYTRSVASAVAALDKEVPAYRIAPAEDGLAKSSAQPRFQAMLITAFAATALLLSAIGLYAVLSYMVAQRRSELGLRMALGAQRSNVLELIFKRGMYLALAGLLIGTAVSLLLTRVLTSSLYSISPLDPVTFVSVAAVLLAVSAFAGMIPAIRASNLDPMESLRDL